MYYYFFADTQRLIKKHNITFADRIASIARAVKDTFSVKYKSPIYYIAGIVMLASFPLNLPLLGPWSGKRAYMSGVRSILPQHTSFHISIREIKEGDARRFHSTMIEKTIESSFKRGIYGMYLPI